MILAIDVYYQNDSAICVGVLFEWQDEKPRQIITTTLSDVAAYIPGQFYKRELPCLLSIIGQVDLDQIEAVIIDGYVYIDNALTFGLGAHLYQSIEGRVPIIGVAKTAFHQNQETVVPVLRGTSQNPLFVSAVGTDLNRASLLIKDMYGSFRIPAILKELDRLTKSVKHRN